MAAADAGLSFSSPCPEAPILPSFNLLAGLVYGDRAVRFLSGEKGSNKKANFALIQTHLETSSLLDSFQKSFLLSPPQKRPPSFLKI